MIYHLTPRDATYVMAHLSAGDAREIAAQYAEPNLTQMALVFSRLPRSFAALTRDGKPAIMFGAIHMGGTTVSGWSVGTVRAPEVLRSVTKFCWGPLRADLKANGYRWAEVRSIAGHTQAHRWIRMLGGRAICGFTGYGIGGETFTLFRGAI